MKSTSLTLTCGTDEAGTAAKNVQGAFIDVHPSLQSIQ